MSTVYFTSDLHFGHHRVASIRGFESPTEHDAYIHAKWSQQVTDRDVVYVLGDIALSHYDYALSLIQTLPGTKHLISGNHDIVHPMHTRGQSRAKQMEWLETFDTVQPFLCRKFEGKQYLLSHFPYASWGDGEHREGTRFNEYRLPDEGIPLLHGHTHGPEREHGNMLHVGWDAWGALVPLKTVGEWLEGQYNG